MALEVSLIFALHVTQVTVELRLLPALILHVALQGVLALVAAVTLRASQMFSSPHS